MTVKERICEYYYETVNKQIEKGGTMTNKEMNKEMNKDKTRVELLR